ncbi:hypothetical protein, conserved [Trypanosoma brucei gambiense DAL972]|uniref:Uncharacterized protein n=1 Tax=Trypanosoma brucei gambiense (strain MHOM/CI/86/DAL972) TaxID=679716 RepID=D0A2T6_TRYB9|nr:hypothetical protein, conserved [Trypanosoma brucei gambiense DAL972]CBH15580.1 hypothetical protein, conserved [Trypanosoma brucei gambiense DAL972]|eukprot:XP_011777844.1 hypothetical protein, conserved [Trypanosoma brucei gambiense DAL972]
MISYKRRNMFLADGRRVLVGNFIMSISTIIVTFYLTQGHLQVGQRRLLDDISPRLSEAARKIGMLEVELPYPFNHVSAVVASPTGIADAGHKVMRFFGTNLRSNIITEKVNGEAANLLATGFSSESTILAHLLSPKADGPLGIMGILHLCSATSCMAPYFTQQYATVTVRPSGNYRLLVGALVYGDVFLGSVVENDLAALDVVLPRASRGREATGAMPLHGVVGGSYAGKSVTVKCSVSINSCQYEFRDDDTDASHPSVTVVHLDDVKLGEAELPVMGFRVVHIDLNSEEQLAIVTYLTGLLHVSARPEHIIVTLYPSPFLEETITAVDVLRVSVPYNVFIEGGRCRLTTNSSTVPSAEVLRLVLRRAGTSASSALNTRSYAAEPLCVLVLSKSITSLSQLLEHVAPTKQEDVMKTFLGTSLDQGSHRGVPCRGKHSKPNAFKWILLITVPLLVAGLLACGMLYGRRRVPLLWEDKRP